MKKLTLVMVLMVAGIICWQTMEAYGQAGAGQQRGVQQVDAAAVVAFLNQQGMAAEAKALEALQKDPAKEAEYQALLMQYNTVMREMERDPAAGKLSVEKMKCGAAIALVLPKAKAGDAAARTSLTTEVGKLFDVIIAQQEALAAAEELAQSPGEQQRTGRGRGLTDAQKAELKVNIELWKKNKAAIVKARVDELLLPYPRLPW